MNELSIAQLRRTIDPASLGITTTQDIAPLEGVIGQQRAVAALQFGLGMKNSGFNLYVAGQPGIGKMSAIKSFLESKAKQAPTPSDLCYVNNFDDSYQPIALVLESGRGRELQLEMKKLVEYIRRELPTAFETEEYGAKRDELINQLNLARAQVFTKLSEKAEASGFGLQVTPYGIMTIPKKDSEPINEAQYQALSKEEQQSWQMRHDALQPEIRSTLKQGRDLERQAQEKLTVLNQQVALYVVGGVIEDILERFHGQPAVVDYLKAVQKDILENIDLFRNPAGAPGAGPQAGPEGGAPGGSPEQLLAAPWLRELPYRKYAVNVLVDNSACQGAPVVLEPNPTYTNLQGRIEKESQFGALYTDFTMIKAGALHRANGGYLVLQIEDILREIYSWDSLKRTVRSGQIQIEELGDRLGFVTSKTLRPQPLPITTKVVLVGRPLYYHLLLAYDPDFAELFKVKADFDTRMPMNEENIRDTLAFLSMICRREGYRHLDSAAAAHIIEHSLRMAEDQRKLSTHFGQLSDIVREASYWANEEQAEIIGRQHVQKALDQRIYRSNLVQERLQEMVDRHLLLIDTSEAVVGQINGLSVINLGDHAFGHPSRITASVEPGSKGVLDIEREVAMGGPIHSKGVLILGGYLARQYGVENPVTLSARLVFEQNYEGVEGDSASSAELYALISALSGLPIRQNIAVTGSVNQQGQVQVIGGVNEKVEGFFDICQARGLTGEQGVMIPAGNMEHLMLRQDVVDAVVAGKFHLWPVSTIDEGIQLLMGVTAGERSDGRFERDTVHGQVADRLRKFQKRIKGLGERSARGNGRL